MDVKMGLRRRATAAATAGAAGAAGGGGANTVRSRGPTISHDAVLAFENVIMMNDLGRQVDLGVAAG
jgi:hypothetical protein